MKLMQRIICTLCLALGLLTAFSQDSAPGVNSGGAAAKEDKVAGPSGQLNFQTDPFTGRFGYSVPMDLAPTRHDSALKIALRYNSSGQSGWVGVGWDLDLGYIQRDTKHGVPVKWSGSGTNLNEYDDSNGFVFSLNGQSATLVNVTSNEFRAEIEGGFLKFLQNTNLNQWLVTDRSGNQFYFGQTNKSRMSNLKPGWSSNLVKGTFRWALDKVETVTGDTSQITYTNISGSLYPLQLAANGHTSGMTNTHTVDFILQDRPEDDHISLISGYRVDLTKRLIAVVHKVGGQQVWSNRLAYTSSASTYNSLLGSVTRFGTNGTTSLPPLSFGYSQQALSFQSPVNWTNLFKPSGGADADYYSLFTGVADLADMDGDGLPDRLLQPSSAPFTNWVYQRNTGGGFTGPMNIGPLGVQVFAGNTTSNNQYWTSIQSTHGRLIDLDGDGLPDRVNDPLESYFNGGSSNIMRTNYSYFVAELNGSSNLTASVKWTNVMDQLFGSDPNGQMGDFRSVENNSFVRMLDMNGDGLPDRVMRKRYQPYNFYVVQFNTGSGFSSTNVFGQYRSQGKTNDLNWAGLDSGYSRLLDINGDGLPDRVMLRTNAISSGIDAAQYQTNYIVELNNGYGFESAITWPGVNPLYGLTCGGGTTTGIDYFNDGPGLALRDVNGDGLIDRLFRYPCTSSNSYWVVQINNGTGFGAATYWQGGNPIGNQGQPTDDQLTGLQSTWATLLDIDGDGLPDRVSAKYPQTSSSSVFVVELSAGPFPDLLIGVTNGIGGRVAVTYRSSTDYDNRETPYSGSPTSDRVRRLLPHSLQTVATLVESDGIHSTNTTSYSYEGGYWNATRREFNGFSKTTVTDPLGGSTVQYFHQSGGRDNSALGEYQDSIVNFAKKGLPFRTETRGTNGLLFSLALQKVEESALSTGRDFAFVTQSLNLDYPAGNTNAYRATANQSVYDLTLGLVTNQVQFGEVNAVNPTNQTFTDIGSDVIHQATRYAILSNPDIVNKPERVIITPDGVDSDATLLRESRFAYDGAIGNLLQQLDRICSGSYRTNLFAYDGYNNQNSATSPAGIVTTTSYDSTSQTFPVSQTVGGTFTSSFIHDRFSGQVVSATDPKGLVVSNRLDTFRRPIESLISSTPNGAADIWQTRIDYGLGGIVSGASKNYVRTRSNDGVDASNGHESWTYFDGLGRAIQQRTEAEANGYRVVDTRYEKRGVVCFVTHPYFNGSSSASTNYAIPTGSKLGINSDYDAIARPIKVSPADSGTFSSGGVLTSITAGTGDVGAPVGPALTSYEDSNDPWVIVATDPESKVRKYKLDAFGRTNQIIEVTSGGNLTSSLGYGKTGFLTNMVDAANNVTAYAYNDLGELVAMADPDLGVWQYARDGAGRIRDQTDANGNRTHFDYTDALGRLKTRLVYDRLNVFQMGVTNAYDSGEAGYTVYPGQLFSTFDHEGWVKSGYDHRNRVLKSTRYLTKTGQSYTTQQTYNDGDNVVSIAYPSSLLTVTNIYDAGRNLVTVRQIGGTNTIFFQAGTFNEFGQIVRINYGNGVSTTNEFWATTKRLKTLVTFKGTTNHQFLSYKYDRADNITNIADTVYTTNASAALAAVYDDLHRLTRVVRPIGTNSYAYTAIGNVVTNGESGTAAYTYGSLLPQAVRSVGGSLYAYDANGNMTVRAGQRLSYDAWNRLARVSTNNQPITAFGYGGDGSRIWKQAGTNLQVWIGNTYEEKQGKQLCQIFAGTRRIATYDSANSLQTGTNFTTLYYYHGDHLGSSSLLTDHAGNRVEHYEYSAFGRENFNDPAQSFAISQRFTGQVLDEETGLYLYGPRYYDPALARFIQPDTVIPSLFDPQSWNRYSYTLNNPLRYVDPSGHEAADYLGEWFAQLRSGRRLDQWASGMGRGFKSFGDAQAFLRSQKDPNGLSEDVALRREQAEGIAVGAKAASALTDAYVNTAPDIASGGIKTGVALGTKAFVSHMGEAPGMMSKVKGWFAKSAAAELPAAGGAVRRFKSFDSFKTALGPAGEGQVWHHIVEQRAANVEKFGAEAIHNTENVINVSRELNQQIANFYSTKQRFSGDQTVRQWLGKQSYEQQREFGIKTIREFSAAAEK